MSTETQTVSGRVLHTAMPFATTLALALLAAVPVRFPGITAAPTDLVLIAVFYWSIYSPRFLPTSVAFAIGLLVDILSGSAPGFNAIILLLIRFVAILSRQAIHDSGFSMTWVNLALIVVLVAAMKWFLTLLTVGNLPDALPVLFMTLSTIAAYPLVWLPLMRLHRFSMQI